MSLGRSSGILESVKRRRTVLKKVFTRVFPREEFSMKNLLHNSMPFALSKGSSHKSILTKRIAGKTQWRRHVHVREEIHCCSLRKKNFVESLRKGSSKDRYIFHVKRTDGLTVLCMADDTAGRRIPFAFLEDIHQRFVRTYGRAVHSANAYGMNDEFSRVLSQQMEYYSNDPNADRINRLKGEMSQVRNVMIENIDKVLERGDRLELLVDKASNMQGNTMRFRKQARRFRNTVWWKNVKLMIMVIILLLVIAYLVLAFVCHGVTLPTCL